MEATIASDAGKFQRALDHAQRRVAVAIHDAVAERTVVGADTQCAVARFAFLDERRKLRLDTRQLIGVLLVGVFADVEFFGVGIVAGIDAHHLAPLDRLHRGVRLEVNVRHHRHIRTTGTNPGDNMLKIGGVAFGLCGDAYDLATGIDQGH